MKFAAALVLVGVFIRHDAANWLAEGSRLSAAAWFYILGGAWEVALCGLLLWVVLGYPYTVWRGLLSAGLAIGMLEGMQMSVCRLAVTDIRTVPTGVNLCDHTTGLPVGAVMTSLYLLLIAWHLGRALSERAE